MQDLSDSFRDYWSLVVEVWTTGVFGMNIGDIIVAFAIFGFFYVLRDIFTRLVLKWLDKWVEQSGNVFGKHFRASIRAPLRFLFIALGLFFAVRYLDFEGDLAEFSNNVNRSLIAIAIFWVFYNAVAPLRDLLSQFGAVLTPEILSWLVGSAKVGVVILGAAAVLQIWGLQIGPIIAGLGLFGVAVALGAQDLFKNLIGGISILVEKRFGYGDWILVDGIVEGTVEKIGFRSTLVRRFDRAPVYVPNQHLSDNAVTNFSAMTHRRLSWKIGLEYRTTHEQLRRILNDIESYLRSTEGFAQPPAAHLFVRIDSFGPSSIDIMIYCFTNTIVWGEWLALKEALAFRVKQAVESAGAKFA
ncbi:mechanosensitive ion channel family protein, partial [Parvibaculum sp.]|uniref:mechanosensitive ion channel family protein n=1 Tax=Parvibaculum sp. TaxID=2024848 RepID=UPI003C78DB4A